MTHGRDIGDSHFFAGRPSLPACHPQHPDTQLACPSESVYSLAPWPAARSALSKTGRTGRHGAGGSRNRIVEPDVLTRIGGPSQLAAAFGQVTRTSVSRLGSSEFQLGFRSPAWIKLFLFQLEVVPVSHPFTYSELPLPTPTCQRPGLEPLSGRPCGMAAICDSDKRQPAPNPKAAARGILVRIGSGS
jgi:hypothetical protein